MERAIPDGERYGKGGFIYGNRESAQQYILTSEQAEALFTSYGKTFHFAARFFSPGYRSSVVTLYAFFRTLDDLVDERPPGWLADTARAELETWQQWFRTGLSSLAPREPLGSALAAVLRTHDIPLGLFDDFLQGLFSDLEPRLFLDFRELYRYCYRVAGTVGLAIAHVLGARSEQALRAAKQLGIAMQLTNILRDVGGDLATGRIYLPQEDLARFGSSSSHLVQLYQRQQGPDERFRAFMCYQIERARLYYAEGLHGSWLLARDCRLPVLLAGRLYQRILMQIEQRNYDVLRGRAATNLLTKIREAGIVFVLASLWQWGEVELAPGLEVLYEEN